MTYLLKLLLCEWSLWRNLCPECNSDAPRLYDCRVCQFHSSHPLTEAKKRDFRRRFLFPETFRNLPNRVRRTNKTNCFRACVATVLGCNVNEVPQGCDGATWNWDEFQDWLAGRGLQAVEMTFANGGTLYPVRNPVDCIVSGPSPRECASGQHAVVAKFLGLPGFELVSDPNASDEWIDGEPTHATFFVPLQPVPPVLSP